MNTLFDKELKSTRLDQNRAVQQLSTEKQELQASLDSANDKISLIKQKQARSEAYAAECLQELGKVRKINTDVDRRNVSTGCGFMRRDDEHLIDTSAIIPNLQTALEKDIKALQVKIVDLETQSYTSSPRPTATKRLESKVLDLQHELDAEIQDRNEALRVKSILEKQNRDYQTQLSDLVKRRDQWVSERGAYEKAIEELQASLKKAVRLAWFQYIIDGQAIKCLLTAVSKSNLDRCLFDSEGSSPPGAALIA